MDFIYIYIFDNRKWNRNSVIREGVEKTFFWEISPKCGWVGWLIPKQGQKTPKSPWKSTFSTGISPFVLPNLTKTLGWVGGKTNLGEISQKKRFFFIPSLRTQSEWYVSRRQQKLSSLLKGSWGTLGFSEVFLSDWHLVHWHHLCRDGQQAATFPGGVAVMSRNQGSLLIPKIDFFFTKTDIWGWSYF